MTKCGGEQSIRYDLTFCPWCGSKTVKLKIKGLIISVLFLLSFS